MSIEAFQKLDGSVNALYFSIITSKNEAKKFLLLQTLNLAYCEMKESMTRDNYYAVCTRVESVEALLIEAGLLKPAKRIGAN